MAAALCAVPVLAAERVDIPGYEARAGAQYRYRVQKTTETDMSSWPGAPVAAPVVMRGDFLLSATVLTRDEAGLRMRWDLSADLPADATGGAGAYPLNALYGGTLAAYGLRQLEIDTDPTGTPTAVPGADAIIATLERTWPRPDRAEPSRRRTAPPGARWQRSRPTRWPSSACWRPKARRSRWRNPRRPRPSPSARSGPCRAAKTSGAFASPPPRHGGWTPTTRPAGALPSARAWPMTRTPSANRSAPRSTPWSLPWANGRNR